MKRAIQEEDMKKRLRAVVFAFLSLTLAASMLYLSGCQKGSRGQQGAVLEKNESESLKAEKNKSRDDTRSGESTGNLTDENIKGDQPAGETPDERNVVIRTAVAAARENNPSLPELRVLAAKMAAGWARVDLEPVDRSTDAASVFLKKSGNEWIVVDMGTGIGPQVYPEAPREIFE